MYNKYSPELIEEILISNDIVSVVSEYVKLEKKGKDYFGLCPFHKEKTPSFSVVPSKQIFYCFGCGKGGNVIHFIMNIEKLDFIEAIKFLAERANINIPESNGREEQEKVKTKDLLFKINKEAARFFYNKLMSSEGAEARKYLNKRGISEKTTRRFGLGWSLDSWDKLNGYLLDKGFEQDIISKSGLVISGNKSGFYDRFRQRIMFPIFDVRGNVIAFGGRLIKSSEGPKYVNSPETIVYSKGKNLYAFNFAKSSNNKRLIIVEGYMDVISLNQYGVSNVAAPLGTALTEAQARLIKRYAEEVIISFDADMSGQKAALRGLDILKETGCSVKVLVMEEVKDPDEYVKKYGVDKYKTLIDNALSLPEYKILKLKTGIKAGNTDDKINFLNKAAGILGKIDNTIERELYIRKIAKEYDVSEQSLTAETNKHIRKDMNKKRRMFKNIQAEIPVKGLSTSTYSDKIIHDERMLLVLLCMENSVYYKMRDKIGINIFSNEKNREIARILLEKLGNNIYVGIAELLNIIKQEDIGDFVRIIEQDCHCDDIKRAVEDKIKNLETYRIQNRQNEIIDILNKRHDLAEGDAEKLKSELRKLTVIIKERKHA